MSVSSAATTREGRVTLPDGRALAYADVGDPRHPTVMLFHGTPGYRGYWRALPGFPYDVPLRFVAPDRPGYGDSDPRPGSTYLDTPDDVAALADHVGVDSFVVVGGSGGGPHALACAWRLPERVTRVVLVSSVGPPIPPVVASISRTNRVAYRVADRAPAAMRAATRLAAWLQRHNPDWLLTMSEPKASPADREALRRPPVRRALRATLSVEALGTGEGYAQDVTLQSRPWGFDLSTIGAPVDVWQPLDDSSAPPAVAAYLQDVLPDCRVHRIPGAGHFWHIEHAETILRSLLRPR